MENQKPKDPFAKVSTFATIKKMQTGKSGREMVVTGFSLGGNQFDEIDDLASNQTEVMVTVQPSRRGTIYAGQDVEYRIVAEDYSLEQDAIAELVIETSNAMRSRMLEKFSDGVTGWDDEETIEDVKAKIQKCVENEDWVDALNLIMILRNLEKPLPDVEEPQEEETEDDGLFAEKDEQPEHEEPDYASMSKKQLQEVAKEMEISGYTSMSKEELLEAVKQSA